jgi:hypothetical protein
MFEVWIKGVLALCIRPTLLVGIRDMLGGMDFLDQEVRLRNSHGGTWHRWDSVNQVLVDAPSPDELVAAQRIREIQHNVRA